MKQTSYCDDLGFEKKEKKQKGKVFIKCNYVPYALIYSSHWSSQHPAVGMLLIPA